MRHARYVVFLFVVILMTTISATARGQTQEVYSLHVGVAGDSNSVGNSGVQAEIQTRIQEVAQPAVTYAFWVGDNLVNGGFIQFGYQVNTPGQYCLYGERTGANTDCYTSYDYFGADDVRWFWQYWPNGNVLDFYFEEGPAYSAGQDSSWHTYQITPNVANGWNFVLDGEIVRSFNKFQVLTSTDPVYEEAEEVTTSSASGNLGPVEFRNLEYLMNGEWQSVTSLKALTDCVPSTSALYELQVNCGIANPYGVSLNGPNDITAGTGQAEVSPGSVLWTSSPTLTLNVPSQVQITIDGITQYPGQMTTTLPVGTPHNVSVPAFVTLSPGTRLAFVDWSTGEVVPNITVTLPSDQVYTLTANYATQYQLTVGPTLYSSGSVSWYDSGTYGNFSIGTYQLLPITFVGWYDVGGNLITSSSSGTILMDGPQTVVPEWQINYPLVAIYALAIIGTAIVVSRRRFQKSPKQEMSEAETIRPIVEESSDIALEAGEHPILEDNCKYSNGGIERYGDTVKYGRLFLTDRDQIVFVTSEGLVSNRLVVDHRYHVSTIKNVSVQNRRSNSPSLAIDRTGNNGEEPTYRYDSLRNPVHWRKKILEARDTATQQTNVTQTKGSPKKDDQFCISCGAKLESGSEFCHKCGARQT